MNPSFYLIALLSSGLTLVSPAGNEVVDLTPDQILARNELWKLNVDELLNKFFELIDRTQTLEALVAKLTTRVAFSVTDPTTTSAGSGDIVLKYATVITKKGADYDPLTGIFTVATPGLYYFTFFFHTTNRKFGTHAGLELHVNDARQVKSIEQVAGADYGDSAGNAMIVDLAAGDLVKVVLREHMCIKDDDLLNTFTGFLLQPSTADPAPAPAAPETYQLRIIDGTSDCNGRVEIFYMNQWGTVCGDYWELVDAEVVCRQQGCGGAFGFGAIPAPQPAEDGVRIWMDNVACRGDELKLSQCGHPGFGDHDCEHADDAGVHCSEPVG